MFYGSENIRVQRIIKGKHKRVAAGRPPHPLQANANVYTLAGGVIF